ncbi:hypothetical protein EDB19DRAFT_1917613 [Suillus lakei]|nr:hypothetical protein EDB19DRAFT_1917613 [Suillus lakei]
MPRIVYNPNLNICPDYASQEHAESRLPLTNANIDEDQAVQILRNIWEAGNNAAKAQWQEQVNMDREQREHRAHIEEEEQARLEQLQNEEEETTRKEERKKNKHKFIPIIEDLVVSSDPTIVPASYAFKKLDKGEYVELWYFTNEGLEEAKMKKTIDDDAMVMSKLPDGSTAWVSAASARSARAVVDDQDLPFEEFCQACPRFIQAMEDAAWPKDCVKMMALFWRNLQIHPFRSMIDPLAQKSLLVYQAEQRKRWHIAVKTVTAGIYNLLCINEKLLETTRTTVYWDDHKRTDNERDYKCHQTMGDRRGRDRIFDPAQMEVPFPSAWSALGGILTESSSAK